DEVSPLVVGEVYCSVVEGCLEVFDLRRAHEWTATLTRWCESQPDLVPFRGQCLIRRSAVLLLHGDWPAALDAARQACQRLTEPMIQPASGAAYYQCGEVHRLRGAFDEADEAYRHASRLGRRPQPGFALMRLAQGHLDEARSAMQLAMDEARGPAARTRLLPAYVETLLAQGLTDDARLGADELARLAETRKVPALTAMAAQAQGAVLVAKGDGRAALPYLREAWTAWRDAGAVHDAARVRVLIGEACRSLGDTAAAEMEFDAARWTFERLGAQPDLARLATLTRSSRQARSDGLSERELQVLRLVAAGRTNRQIADQLLISDRTVERHVSNIF